MSAPTLQAAGPLPADDVAAVRALVEDVEHADGVAPLSEHVMLHLPQGGDAGVRNLLARDGGRVVGYAHLDVTDVVEGSSAELAVHPSARRHGVGRRLVEALLDETPDGRLRLWAHGEHPGASALATSLGFRSSRVLWQMRRSLDGPLPEPRVPDGVTVRTFRVGEDEQAWTEVNNRAFADHPDQGGWSIEEVRLREAEPWFDPAGFFLAERDGRLVGSHWTKVHGGTPGHGHAHEPLGEVYVVGIDPDAQGLGLGPALTLIGLRSLQARGLHSVLLYVDESNGAAVRTYERLGFTRWATDVCWSRT